MPPDAVACIDERSLDGSYAYLLGLYLGDGMLSRHRRHVWKLRISLDAKYPFVWACHLVHVDCRRSNARNIAVSRRANVAILDDLVGPKA